MVLRFFWLGVIEATRPELCPSFFQVDLAPAVLGFLGRNNNPSSLDPATLGYRRRGNAVPLAPPTLGSPRRGDTYSPLAPGIVGVSNGDTSPPLIPEIPGVLGRDDTSPPLAREILGALRRGDTPPPAFSSIYIPLSSSSASDPVIPCTFCIFYTCKQPSSNSSAPPDVINGAACRDSPQRPKYPHGNDWFKNIALKSGLKTRDAERAATLRPKLELSYVYQCTLQHSGIMHNCRQSM
jgi:hypothetical protein